MGDHSEEIHRQGHRIRTGMSAELHTGGQSFGCEAQNISRTGVLLVGDITAQAEDVLEFTLRAPTGGMTVRLKGRVARVHPNPDGGGLRLALEFVEVDDSQRGAIEVLVARILESPVTGPFDALKPGAAPQVIRKALESIPLAQRIALCSRTGAKEREYLRSDTHPAVLEALVRNPHLTVVEARALALSPYLMSGTLDVLSSDPRFKGDEELYMAIAVHPRVALGTAERVTADFKVPQIKKLLARPGVNQVLREKLFRRTTQR